MRCLFASIVVAAACASLSSAAWADWGCGYRYSNLMSGRHGSNWGEPDQVTARKTALGFCKTAGHRGCYIVSCHANIDNVDQAQALWPLGGRVNKCYGNGC